MPTYGRYPFRAPLRGIMPDPVYVEDRHEITQGVPHCFIVGLDLGKSQDFTALCVVELHKGERLHWRRTAFEPIGSGPYRRQSIIRHQVVNLHRYPRGTPYPEIYRSVQSVMRQLPPRERKHELVVDKTGVGAPVVDSMRAMGMTPIAVSITGGRVANMNDHANYTVPKALLASVLDITLSEERLEITEVAGASEALRMELQNFHAKVNANGSVSLEAWRESAHDDLVLAMALAVWRGENQPQPSRWFYSDHMAR